MNRYQNSKIYKLFDDDQFFYIGSTCLSLHKRLYNHKIASALSQRKVYKMFTRDKFDRGEIKIILLEYFQLNTKEELLREENKYIDQHIYNPFCLNSMHSFLTIEERKEYSKKWYSENKEDILNRQKAYYEQNIERIKVREKQYVETNRDYIREYRKCHHQKNKEKDNLSNKDYYEKNKHIVLKKIKCECGVQYSKNQKMRHERSQYHNNYLENSKIQSMPDDNEPKR